MTLLSLAILTSSAPLARADSPSETLEKAIYSEETKGDLDGAMTLYQQVIEQAKTSQALAAQAQYRLGVCQAKTKLCRRHRRLSGWSRIIPIKTNLVALARDYLARNNDLLPAPWADGEEERFDVKLAAASRWASAPGRRTPGRATAKKSGASASSCRRRARQASHVEVDADTMKPIHSRWKHNFAGRGRCRLFLRSRRR